MITLAHRNIIIISFLVILFVIQYFLPYIRLKLNSIHALRNFSIGIINAIIINLLFVPFVILATNSKIGLFSGFNLDWTVELILTIVMIDFVAYVLHVIYHKVPILWRFHKVHHSDTEMDVTTSFRFHLGEHIVSILVRIIFYIILSIRLEFILIYETLFIINVMFHHSNISIGRFDKYYRIFFTSPYMHKIHHSNIQKETDSNYTSLFSIWDRLFRTYRTKKDYSKIVFGIKGLENEQSIMKMLMTPFKN